MSQPFDLLGDPIPEGWGRRGRPVHMVTDEKRKVVIMLCAFGRDEDHIAAAIGITRPTLRKHYFRELRAKAEARARLEAQLLSAQLAEIEKGNMAAASLLYKRLDKLDIAALPSPKAAPKLGKKDQANARANRPPKAWGDLVSRH